MDDRGRPQIGPGCADNLGCVCVCVPLWGDPASCRRSVGRGGGRRDRPDRETDSAAQRMLSACVINSTERFSTTSKMYRASSFSRRYVQKVVCVSQTSARSVCVSRASPGGGAESAGMRRTVLDICEFIDNFIV
eukprot:1902361-Prymnesium_polylepis.1